MMKGKYLLLGTNLGDRKSNLSQAISAIQMNIGDITARSAIYKTGAWGFTDQPDFFNQVIKIKTELLPGELLEKIEKIQLEMGRIRWKNWRARLIDIDILYYDNLVLDSPELRIPHPEIQNRRFTLVPLCEIAPQEVHPELKKSNADLLDETMDTLEVKKI